MTTVRLTNGRLYIKGRRLHHGLAGCLLLLIGTLLAWHDLKDWPWPMTPEWDDR